MNDTDIVLHLTNEQANLISPPGQPATELDILEAFYGCWNTFLDDVEKRYMAVLDTEGRC